VASAHHSMQGNDGVNSPAVVASQGLPETEGSAAAAGWCGFSRHTLCRVWVPPQSVEALQCGSSPGSRATVGGVEQAYVFYPLNKSVSIHGASMKAAVVVTWGWYATATTQWVG